MSHPLLSRRDLEFLLHEWLGVEDLVRRERYAEHDRATVDAVLEVAEQVATEHVAPLAVGLDRDEPVLADGAVRVHPALEPALRRFADSGLLAGTVDADRGGVQLPHVVHQACLLWFQAASIAAAAYPMLTIANANLLLAHGTDEQVRRFVPALLDGRWTGTMCISEPQAGSSLADIATRAVRQEDGTYRLFGNKMWISGGDHEMGENILHLVLARVEGAPAGVKGLSLFATPKWVVGEDGARGERNDVVTAGLNHKMGYRGTTNAALNFGEGVHRPGGRAGAVGELVGAENGGLATMFHMMNEARIGVGASGVALGYTAYLRALAYAGERVQGRPHGPAGRTSAPVPLVEHPDVRRMLLASKSYVEGGLALVLYAARLLDDQVSAEDAGTRERAGALLDVLTPVVKSWPARFCLAANDHAIQVHGGYGYTRDYTVEQLWRDNRLNAIHEGTHGIQALDLVGRKLVADDGRGMTLLQDAIADAVGRARASGDAQVARHATDLETAAGRLRDAVGAAWADGDPRAATLNASTVLDAAGHMVVAWMWVEQLVAAHGRTGAFYDGKRAAARYFFAFELPLVEPALALVERGERLLDEVDPGWL